MNQRHFMSSILWSLAPLAAIAGFVFHAILWLGLIVFRKSLGLRYRTGFASTVLLERSQLRSALMCASFVVFRLTRILRRLGFEFGIAFRARSPVGLR